MPSLNARGHTAAPWQTITPATGMEVGGTSGHRGVGVGDYTLGISGDVADQVLFDLMVEDWLDQGILSPGSKALAEYRSTK